MRACVCVSVCVYVSVRVCVCVFRRIRELMYELISLRSSSHPLKMAASAVFRKWRTTKCGTVCQGNERPALKEGSLSIKRHLRGVLPMDRGHPAVSHAVSLCVYVCVCVRLCPSTRPKLLK